MHTIYFSCSIFNLFTISFMLTSPFLLITVFTIKSQNGLLNLNFLIKSLRSRTTYKITNATLTSVYSITMIDILIWVISKSSVGLRILSIRSLKAFESGIVIEKWLIDLGRWVRGIGLSNGDDNVNEWKL